MESLTSEDTQQFAAEAAIGGFFMLSPWRSLAAQGCVTTISTPARDGEHINGGFQQEIRRHLSAARRQGIADPMVVGAIPFDTRQPSALFIPERCRFFDGPLFRKRLPPPTRGQSEILRHSFLPDRDTFLQMVSRAVAATAASQLDKVVLSRLMEIVTRQPVDIADLMQRMMIQNPEGYAFHVPLPQGGTLIGASPELLMRRHAAGYETHPLAGSIRRENTRHQDRLAGQQLLDSRKDRYEHQLVVEAVRARLQTPSRDMRIPSTPQLLATSTLWHLGTPIAGTLHQEEESALSLACLLHPTPALSGFPHDSAIRLIAELEPFDRGLFGGMVGWCDGEGNGEWVVTIRCGRIQGNRLRLFAGAGIVPDSVAECEWRETEAKMTTMLRAFGLS